MLAANGAALLDCGMINVGEFPLFAHLGSGAFGFGIATAGYGVGKFIGSRVGDALATTQSGPVEAGSRTCGGADAARALVVCP